MTYRDFNVLIPRLRTDVQATKHLILPFLSIIPADRRSQRVGKSPKYPRTAAKLVKARTIQMQSHSNLDLASPEFVRERNLRLTHTGRQVNGMHRYDARQEQDLTKKMDSHISLHIGSITYRRAGSESFCGISFAPFATSAVDTDPHRGI